MPTAPTTYSRARQRSGPLPLSTKVFQAVGALPEALKVFAFNTFLLFYYNQVLGLGALAASTAIGAALVIDAAVDPLIGSFSDGLKARLGRRHPLMYLSVAPMGLGLFLAFSPPTALGQTALTAWLFGTVVVTHVSMSLFVVPWTALYAEFSDNYDERTSIVTWRYAIGWMGSLAFIASSWGLIFARTPGYARGQLNPHAYAHFAPFAALAVAGAALIATELTRREIPYLLQPTERAPPFRLARVWGDIASTLANRDFLILFVGALLTAGVTGTTDSLAIYLSTWFWGLRPDQLQWFSLSVLGAIVAFLTLGPLEKRFDKKPVLLASFLALLVDGTAMVGLRLAGLLPANGDPRLVWILVGNEIVRTWLATLLGIMFVSMLADCIDMQELRTGRRQEGIFSAALAFSGKATAGVGGVAAGLLLQQVVRWPARATSQSLHASTITELGIVSGIAVPLFLLVPFAIGLAYRTSRESHRLIRQELDRRRGLAPMSDEPRLGLATSLLPPGEAPRLG